MAPTAAVISPTSVSSVEIEGDLDFSTLKLTKEQRNKQVENYKYKHLLPINPEVEWPELEIYEYNEKAFLADPKNNYKNLLRDATKVKHLSPKIGTVIEGVNLATLDDEQKNELALLTSHRIAVFFKKQTDLDIHKQLELGRYYGPLHKNHVAGYPVVDGKELDEVVVVHSDSNPKFNTALAPSYQWHTDASYENQPPSYTSLKIFTTPNSGGDTTWVSGYVLYDLLSPFLQKYLEGLFAVHDDTEQTAFVVRNGRKPRRKTNFAKHPVIRTHPVTGFKSLFVTPAFTKYIIGIPRSESDAILKYLFNLIETTQDGAIRYTWEEDDVAFWDNRSSFHIAIYGFYPERRHGTRVTPYGEVPYFDSKGKSQQQEIERVNGGRKTIL